MAVVACDCDFPNPCDWDLDRQPDYVVYGCHIEAHHVPACPDFIELLARAFPRFDIYAKGCEVLINLRGDCTKKCVSYQCYADWFERESCLEFSCCDLSRIVCSKKNFKVWIVSKKGALWVYFTGECSEDFQRIVRDIKVKPEKVHAKKSAHSIYRLPYYLVRRQVCHPKSDIYPIC